jgi:hypothetical protein
MTLAHKITFAAALVLLGAVFFVGYQWLQEHDGRLKVEAQTAVQQKDIEALRATQQQTADTLKAQLAAIALERQQPVAPAQFVVDASKLLPNLPQPVAATPVDTAKPDGPQQVVIPAADLPAFRNYKLTCDAATDSLAACTSTQQTLKAQVALTEAQRDEWQKAAKGGSIWHRALKVAEYVGIGAAVGYAAHRH